MSEGRSAISRIEPIPCKSGGDERFLDCITDSVTICPGEDPIPVTFNDATFTGTVDVHLTCATDSITICPGDDPIDVSGSTVALDAGTLAALETITVLQGTSPWVIGDGGGSITVDGSVSITGTVAVTQSTSPWIVSGTVTADTNFDYPEDSPHVSGNPGAFVLAVRNDAGTPLAADGDYIPFTTDATGALRVNATFTGDISVALDCATDSVTICPGADPIDVSGSTVALDAGTLAALETITVLQGTSPWVIGDGGGSITVDGTVTVTQGTSPWVIGDGGGSITVDGTVTADTNFDYPEDSVHVSGDPGAFVLAVRNDAGTPLAANGDYIPFTTDATGALRVNAGATVTQTGRDDTDNQAAVTTGLITSVDRNYVWDSVGGNWDRWTGAVTQGTSPWVVSGTVTVNQGTSPWVVSGTVAATQSGSWNVTILNGAGAAAVNIQDGGNSITVDGTVSISGTVTVDTNFDYAEDAPHVSGDVGAFVLAVRNDANAAFTNTNGDYSPIAVNANGAIAINDGGNSITVDGTVTVNQGTSPWVTSLDAATLAALESITVQNPGGASAVNIQDGGNSITVDGSVSITGTVAVTQSTSPWVVSGTVSATTNFSYVEDSPHVSGDPGAFVLAVRNDANAAFTNTNGDYSPIAVNSAGAIAISDGGNSITVDGTVSAAQSGAWSVTILNGAGAAAVNIQDGGNSITVDGAVTVSGTVATNSERAEDSGHTSGQIGNFVLGVRNDTASVLTSTDLDYTPFATDSAGRIGISDLGGAISIDDNGGSITIDGTVSAAQSGAWSVTVLNGSGAAAVNIQDGGNSITVDGTVSISGTVTVDTELPAASALADADANPTTSRIGSNGLVFNGTTWDRARSAQVGDNPGITGIPANLGYVVESGTIVNRIRQFPTSDGVTNTGFQGVGIMVTAAAGVTSNRVRDPSTDAIGVGLIADGNMGFNGSNWDRIRSGGDDTDNQAAISLGVIKTIGRNYVWDAGGGNWDRWTGAITDGGGSITVDGTVSISGTVAVTQSTSPWVVSGTVTVNQGTSPWVVQAGSERAEDSGHTSGQTGNFVLAVRNDTAAVLTSTDLDYSPFAVDSSGRIGISDLGGSITVDGTVSAAQSGAWSVTILNGAGAAAVNIQDGGNSITVDGTVAISGTVAVTQSTSPWVVSEQSGTLANGAETAVSSSAVQIVASNANRKKLIVQNTGTANIRVGITGVTATTGARIVPNGTLLYEMPNCPTNAIFAIREGASDSIAFAEEIT